MLPADFWVYPLRYVHFFFAKLLMVLIALHVLGALYHLIFRRDGLFRRMWFGKRDRNLADLPTKAVPKAAE
jgi:cytochrome b561